MMLFILLLGILLLALPFLVGAVGFCLLLTKRWKTGFILIGFDALWLVFLLVEAHVDKRSSTGHFARWCLGAGTAIQEVDDQAEDLKHSPSLAQTQNWAVKIMRQYASEKVKTAGDASYWSCGSVKLDSSEIPPFVSGVWKEDPPEVSIKLSDGRPECVVLAWYGKGIVFGKPDYHSPISNPNYQKEVIPGVYAYATYK